MKNYKQFTTEPACDIVFRIQICDTLKTIRIPQIIEILVQRFYTCLEVAIFRNICFP